MNCARCAAQVVEAFLNLNEGYQLAIADVTRRMGAGMAEFITKEARRTALAQSCGNPLMLLIRRW